MRGATASFVAGSAAIALIAADVSPAYAQSMGEDLSPTGKGIAGCALLGAEAVLLIEAAAGLDAAWAYIVFPILGAAGGGIGGFFMEDADQSELSVASLALGVALIIPTTVLVLSATSYDPEDEDDGGEEEEEDAGGELQDAEDAEGGGGARIERPAESGSGAGATDTGGAAPAPGPATETPPATGGGTAPQSRLRRSWRPRHAPMALGGALVSARADNGFSLGVGVPNISVTGLYSAREQATLAQLGVRAGGTEVRIDLLRLAF